MKIHCKTEELANEVLAILDRQGYKWLSGDKLSYDNYYQYHEDKTYYGLNDKRVFYGCVDQTSEYVSAELFIHKKNKIAYKATKDSSDIISYLESIGGINNNEFKGETSSIGYSYYLLENNRIWLGLDSYLRDNGYTIKEFRSPVKEVKIPEGYEIDTQNSTSEYIRFKKKEVSYEEVLNELFNDKLMYYINIHRLTPDKVTSETLMLTSERQIEQVKAYIKLMNVARYLNKDWRFRWAQNEEKGWSIHLDRSGEIRILASCPAHTSEVFFKTKELAQQAVSILGIETIKQAISYSY